MQLSTKKMKLKCLRNRKPFSSTDLEDTSTDITFNLTWKESGLELMSVYGKLSYELDIVGINRDLLRFNRFNGVFMRERKFMALGIIEHRELFAGDLSRDF
jgi:hypothetical protein